MEVRVNGKAEKLETQMNIMDFVTSKGLEPKGVVMLVNDEMVKREFWSKTLIEENDSLEVLRFVSGG